MAHHPEMCFPSTPIALMFTRLKKRCDSSVRIRRIESLLLTFRRRLRRDSRRRTVRKSRPTGQGVDDTGILDTACEHHPSLTTLFINADIFHPLFKLNFCLHNPTGTTSPVLLTAAW